MNVLHEPWQEDAQSEDLSWGPAQPLAHAEKADEVADTATSQAKAKAAQDHHDAQAVGDREAAAEAEARFHELEALTEPIEPPPWPALCWGAPQHIDLGTSYKGPRVRVPGSPPTGLGWFFG